MSQEQEIQHIFDFIPDGILLVGLDGSIQQANVQAENLFGYDRGELQGMSVEMLIPTRFHQQHRQNRANYVMRPHIRPMGSGLELFGRRKDASEFPVDITLGPLGESPDAIVCTVRDITEHRQLLRELAGKNQELHILTQQLWQSAKLASMGELAASIAHELNNPLGIVSLRVESLLSQVPENTDQYRALVIIAQEVERMGRLVSSRS